MPMAKPDPQDIYRVRGGAAEWHVEINERTGMSYATKEAAFDAAVDAASSAIRDGHEVIILVPGAEPGETASDAAGPCGAPAPSPA